MQQRVQQQFSDQHAEILLSVSFFAFSVAENKIVLEGSGNKYTGSHNSSRGINSSSSGILFHLLSASSHAIFESSLRIISS